MQSSEAPPTRRDVLRLGVLPFFCRSATGGEVAAEWQPYFPNLAYQLVWRNWDIVSPARIAECLRTDERTIQRMAAHLHLASRSACQTADSRWEFNILRRNWFFVPRTQIASLLNTDQAGIDRLLDRDAFYRSHLGEQAKYEPILFREDLLVNRPLSYFDEPAMDSAKESRFAFEQRLSQPVPGFEASPQHRPGDAPVIAYPYFCPYGDVLTDPEYLRYYPLGLLERMAQSGVTAIWVHALLRDLVESPLMEQDYPFRPERRDRLIQLTAHCRKAGLGVYLYLNEPRGAHDRFFRHHPEMRGAPGRKGDGLWCMCTSSPETLRFLREGSRQLFEKVPALEGLILITASENPTNCYSLTRHPDCPRCSRRRGADVIAEVVREHSRGAHAAKPASRVIAWDWSWTIVEDNPQSEIIRALPEGISLMVDFERGTEIERGGIRSKVDEYSLSVPGPSPQARQHIALAAERRMEVLGKAQIGTTWEVGTLPFLPIPGLVAEKILAFRSCGLRGGMFSWTLGSCPSPNWDVLAGLLAHPNESSDAVMRNVARERYGSAAATAVLASWKTFTDAFRNYPYSNTIVYSSFVQEGAANRLYLRPSGLAPRIFNSFDSLGWTAPFGPDRAAALFAELGRRWRKGVAEFHSATMHLSGPEALQARQDSAVIEAAGLYFDAVALEIRFYRLRDHPQPRSSELQANVSQQLAVARRFLALCYADSRIGFEASVGYLYLPQDVREKIAACRFFLRRA